MEPRPRGSRTPSGRTCVSLPSQPSGWTPTPAAELLPELGCTEKQDGNEQVMHQVPDQSFYLIFGNVNNMKCIKTLQILK